MKINKYLMATAAIAVFGAGVLSYGAAYAIDDDLTVDAVIVESLTIDCSTQNLDFGDIDPGASGGTVTVDTTGFATYGGTTVNVASSVPTEGTCTLTGDGALAYDVTIPASTTITSVALDTMTVNNFTVDDGTGAGASPYVANLVAGAGTLSIGGDLVVAAGQAAGTYTGTINIDAVYQ